MDSQVAIDPRRAEHAVSRPARRRFYTWMSVVVAVIVLAGFSRTYYLKAWFGTPPLTWRLHLHGLFMTLWVVLFLVQARLIAIGRRRLHRALGVAGVVVGVLAMVSTYAAAMETARLGAWGDQTATRLFSQVLVITLFSAFAGAGVVYRKRPEIHKRLMLLATIAALGPAAVRAVRLIAGPGLPDPHIPVEAVMLMAALMYDWRTRGRPHAVLLYGGLLLIGSQMTRRLAGGGEVWARIAGWLIG